LVFHRLMNTGHLLANSGGSFLCTADCYSPELWCCCYHWQSECCCLCCLDRMLQQFPVEKRSAIVQCYKEGAYKIFFQCSRMRFHASRCIILSYMTQLSPTWWLASTPVITALLSQVS
jgi:hypothetical protein